MKRGWIIALLIIAALIAAKFIFFPKADEGAQKGKSRGPAVVAVNYHVVAESMLQNELFAAGLVGAYNQVDLVPETAGKVVSINFTEGEHVEKGRLLVKLNDQDLQAQLIKVRAQMRLSQQKLERINKLLAVNGVSREEYEMQENEINTLKADESFLLAQIAKTSIVAPFAGVAGLRNASPGSFVNTSTPIASLVQMKPLYVEFSVPERYASRFKKGLRISFTTDASGGAKTHTATISAIEPRVDESTKTIRARALYEGNATLYPGSYVNVQIAIGSTENALLVPAQCVVPKLSGHNVFRIVGDSAVETEVQIGLRDERSVQITAGLKAGDSIVASGMLAVKNGSKVKLLKPVN